MRLKLFRRQPGDPFLRVRRAAPAPSEMDAKIRAMLAHYMADGNLEAIPKDYLDRSVPALEDMTPHQFVATYGLARLEDVLDSHFTVAHGMPE